MYADISFCFLCKGERPYPCVSCDSAFRTHSDLRKHRMAVHKDQNIQIIHKTETGTYACEECNLKFQLYSQLTVHNRKVHDKTLYYECSRCDKSFGSSVGLRYHLRRCGERVVEEVGDYEAVEVMEEGQLLETKIEILEEYEFGGEYLEEEICSS
jgi:DNA-directed RNA polymerase subunit RPC12/RpoP